MPGRNLFAPQTEAPVDQQNQATGRNLLAPPPTEVVEPSPPSMVDLFDQYKQGGFSGDRRAAVEELMRRTFERVGQPAQSTLGGEESQGPAFTDISPIESPAPEPKVEGLGKSTAKLAGSMVKNLPGSTLQVLNDFGQALMDPLTTANTIGNVALGAVQKLIPGEQEAEQTFNMMVEGFRDRYGSLEQLNESMANDPAGVLMDIAGIMTGGGMALRQVPKFASYGDAMVQAGNMIDPMAATGRAASKGVSAAGEGSAQIIGALTGEGPQIIKQATKGTGMTSDSSPFVAGMRGAIGEESLVTSMTEAMRTIRDNRSTRYRSQLAELGKDTTEIPMEPIKNRLTNLMGRDRYNILVDDKGKLDFSRSSIQKSERAKVREIVDDIASWGTREGDNTAMGLDILKKKLDNFYSENANTRAFVASLRDEVKNTIVKEVPEYARMTADYEKTTRLIRDLEQSLALGKKANMDTTLKKLTSAVKDDFDFRHNLLKELEDISGRSLSEEIAGLSMQGIVPKRLTGRVAAGGAVGIAGTGAASPWLLSIAALTSPRVMGEFLNSFGFGKRQVNKAIGVLKRTGAFDQAPRQAAAIAGRAEEEE